jgi:hypothetical protein
LGPIETGGARRASRVGPLAGRADAIERDDLQSVLDLESTFEQLAMEIAGKDQ